MTKNFKLPWSETQRLQIRWEAYNAFNHHVFALPVTLIDATNFRTDHRVCHNGARYAVWHSLGLLIDSLTLNEFWGSQRHLGALFV